jgi:F0F1-type ATP synthase assembly protein I
MPDAPADRLPPPDDEDPFKKVNDELRAMELPDVPTEEDIEARLRRALEDPEGLRLTSDEEIEAMAAAMHERLAEAGRAGVSDEDEFDRRLRDLEQRMASRQRDYVASKSEQDRVREADRQSAKGLGVGLAVAYAIVGTPMLGAGIGWLIDNRVGSDAWVGILTLCGAALGVAFAILILNRPGTIK